MIESRNYHRDQTALMHSSCVKNQHISLMPSQSYLNFPDRESMAAEQRDLFMHFTNTGRLRHKSWHSSIKQYMSSVMNLDVADLNPWEHFSCKNGGKHQK